MMRLLIAITLLLLPISGTAPARPVDPGLKRFVAAKLRAFSGERFFRSKSRMLPFRLPLAPVENEYRIVNQDITFAPNFGNGTGTISCGVTIKNVSSSSFSQVRIGFYAAPITSVKTSQGGNLTYTYSSANYAADVTLASSLDPNATTTVVLNASGTLQCIDWGYCRAGNDSFFLPSTYHAFHPAVDNKYTMDLKVEVPNGWTVAAAPPHVSTEDIASGKRFTFSSASPSYMFGFSASPNYSILNATAPASANNTPIKMYYLSGLEATGQFLLDQFNPVLGHYSTDYGIYPYPKYDMTLLNNMDFAEGLAMQSMAFLSHELFTGSATFSNDETMFGFQTMSHETAHQWFGELVDAADEDRDIFLIESMAEFSSATESKRILGSRSHFHYNAMAYQCMVPESSDEPILSYAVGTSDYFVHIVYMKGSVVADMLKSQLGETGFYAGMKNYITKQNGKFASVEQYRADMEEANSGTDLGWFFNQWVYRKGYPKITARAKVTNQGVTSKVEVKLEQTTGDKWRVKVPVLLELKGGTTRLEQADWSGNTQDGTFTFNQVPGVVQSVRIDPDRHLVRSLIAGTAQDANLSGLVDGMDLLDVVYHKEASYGTLNK